MDATQMVTGASGGAAGGVLALRRAMEVQKLIANQLVENATAPQQPRGDTVRLSPESQRRLDEEQPQKRT
jgi:hypothetical protein